MKLFRRLRWRIFRKNLWDNYDITPKAVLVREYCKKILGGSDEVDVEYDDVLFSLARVVKTDDGRELTRKELAAVYYWLTEGKDLGENIKIL